MFIFMISLIYFFLIGPRLDGYSNYSSTVKNIDIYIIYLLQSIQLKLYEIIKTVQLSFEQKGTEILFSVNLNSLYTLRRKLVWK